MAVRWLLLFDTCLLALAWGAIHLEMVGLFVLFAVLFWGFSSEHLYNGINRSTFRIRGTCIHPLLAVLAPMLAIALLMSLKSDLTSILQG